MENYNTNNSFDWNSAIEDDGDSFPLLEPGDYNAVITWIERSRYNGGKVIQACDMQIVTLRIDGPDGPHELKVRLYLCQRNEWKLSEFFRGIGRKKRGERIVMSWDGIIGLPVHVRVSKKELPPLNGETHTINEVTRFYDFDPKYFPSDPAWLEEAMKAEEEPIDEVF